MIGSQVRKLTGGGGGAKEAEGWRGDTCDAGQEPGASPAAHNVSLSSLSTCPWLSRSGKCLRSASL